MAEAIIGKIGVDMTKFPTAAHMASWAGMCPGQHESAGKARHGTARHGNSWLQRHLSVAAMSASRTKDTYLDVRAAASAHWIAVSPRATGPPLGGYGRRRRMTEGLPTPGTGPNACSYRRDRPRRPWRGRGERCA